MKTTNLLLSATLLLLSVNLLMNNEREASNETATKEVVTEQVNENEEEELFEYRTLRAFKSNLGDIEYFYLHDAKGMLYTTSEELIVGQDYIVEIGKYSDEIYELTPTENGFDEETEGFFEEFYEDDKKYADEVFKSKMNFNEL